MSAAAPERRFQSLTMSVAAPRRLGGLAAVFNTPTAIGDFVEIIRPGAFAASLATGADVLALADHDPTRVLGRRATGTLRLAEDAVGLAFEVDLPDTAAARDLLALAERGDLGGASFAFKVESERWTGSTRELLSLHLLEVSVVSAWPAYPGTSVSARASSSTPPRLALARRRLDLLRG